MYYLYTDKNNTHYQTADKTEKELNNYLAENWDSLFPHLTLSRSNFLLKGINYFK